MTNKTKAAIPIFKTLEEEIEYWEAQGPFAKGKRGRVSKPKAKERRSSFLAVRLSGEELTRLRDVAAKEGVGPSTFARKVLLEAMGQSGARAVTKEELTRVLEAALAGVRGKGRGKS
ncbi:MAG: hypothetical protein FJ320_10250 [SAR202 cluster bacterium]|nr:hypothetical protein [SAR202 cluster bacterium]